VLLAQASFGYAFSSFLLLPKYLKVEFNASAAQIGLVSGVSSVAAMLALLACGVAVDRWGRRRFLTAGGVLMAAASLGFGAVEEIGPLLYALRVAQSLAFAMTFTASAALVVDLAPPGRLTQAIGFFGLTMLSMNAIAPSAVEAMAELQGWNFALQIPALGALLCVGFSLFVVEPKRAAPIEGEVPSLWSVVRDAQQLRAGVVIGIVGCAFATMFVFHQPFALELGFSRLRGFFIAYSCAALVARFALGPVVERIGGFRVAVSSLMLYGAVVALGSQLSVVGLVWLGGSFGLAHGFFYPACNALAIEGVSEHARGKAMALFQAWFNAGLAIGTLGMGILADAFGFPVVFLLGGGLISIAVVVLLGWSTRRLAVSVSVS